MNIDTSYAQIHSGYPTVLDHLGKQTDGRFVWRITVINVGSVQEGHVLLWGFEDLQDFHAEIRQAMHTVITVKEYRYDRKSNAQVCVLHEPSDCEQSHCRMAA